jgi:hypothetical protein
VGSGGEALGSFQGPGRIAAVPALSSPSSVGATVQAKTLTHLTKKLTRSSLSGPTTNHSRHSRHPDWMAQTRKRTIGGLGDFARSAGKCTILRDLGIGSRTRSGLHFRPEGTPELSPGFQPWVNAFHTARPLPVRRSFSGGGKGRQKSRFEMKRRSAMMA